MTTLTLVRDGGQPVSRVVTAPGRDAELLALIERFRVVDGVIRNAFHAMSRLPKRSDGYKAQRAIWDVAAPDRLQLEKRIALTPATTVEGAKAKAQLGYDMLGGDDLEGEDLLDSTTGHCRLWAVALAGTRDLLHVVGAASAVRP